MKTIQVKGMGNVTAKPDYIVLSLSIKSKEKEYASAMEGASKKINLLKAAVSNLGFEENSLKTTHFNVSTEYDNKRDLQGGYQRIFSGYVCSYQLKLSFDFDSKLLAQALSEISSSQANPELSIAFTVKDCEAVKKQLLKNAAVNAREKAEILCQASGVKLGQLVNIDYNWKEINILSPTLYQVEESIQPLMAANRSSAVEIEPDDIDISDSVAFVWEIL